jgi:DNA-binding NarL/FixJ family response regulator
MQKCILIVDDSAEIRNAIRRTFEGRNGFRVCGEAVNGQDGIEKAKLLKPDLIILDFSMPLMNGLEAARAITLVMPSVPLILFTMHTGDVLESDARKAGFRSIVSKSQDVEFLVVQAQTLLGIAAAKR